MINDLRIPGFPTWNYVDDTTVCRFRYIKIQLDSEAKRTQTKEVNKLGYSISFVCAL